MVKVIRTLFIESDVYEKAQQVFGQRSVSAAIERMLLREIYQDKYECRSCKAVVTEIILHKMGQKKNYECIECGSTDMKLIM